MDATNTPSKHLCVGVFSIALAFIFHYFLGIQWSTAFARVAFILLFFILLIGPFMRLTKPKKRLHPKIHPWSWRGELGIWFTITSLIHFYFVMGGRPNWSLLAALGGWIGGSGYGLSNFIGLVALFWAIILTITSFGRVIRFLGIESWKWINSMTYVIFYLVSAHFIYFQFFTTYGDGPDWFGYSALAMSAFIVILQMSAFINTIRKH